MPIIYKQFKNDYNICITRDLQKEKQWLKEKVKGKEGYVLISSSGAKRLRKYGIWV